jgi:hypothetical protein
VTISLFAPADGIRLGEIDFSGTFLGKHLGRSHWSHTYSGRREEGYLAATCALDLAEGEATLPPTYDESIAFVTFSVSPQVPIGSAFEIRFRDMPGHDGLPPIPNELVRKGEPQHERRCGLVVRIAEEGEFFVRGDVNRDGRLSVTDAVEILRFLYFYESHELYCTDAADTDDNGRVEITDASRLMRFLFSEGPPPLPPFPGPGTDSLTPDDLPCNGRG